ncbi:MAG TPA: hypothetical protein VK925_05745 [Jiangellaceae bacterium]|nr:hypothetical protein [Jiangellaceae bacterium]
MDDVDAPPAGASHPDWLAPPPSVLGQVVAGQLLLARSDRAAVVLTSVLAYPSGFEFHISAILREPASTRAEMAQGRAEAFSAGAAVPRPRTFVETAGGPELTLTFADGTTLSNGRPGPLPEHDVPGGPVLVPVEATTDDRRRDARFWVWSLPPEGPVTIECAWPAQEITYGRVEISGALIRQAAAGAVELWP